MSSLECKKESIHTHWLDCRVTPDNDGFSFDVLGKSVLQSVYSANLPEQKYRTPNRQSATSVTGSGTYANDRNERGTDIGTRYRYIDENPLVPIPESGSSSSTLTSTTKTRSRPNNEYVLYSYGEPVVLIVNRSIKN